MEPNTPIPSTPNEATFVQRNNLTIKGLVIFVLLLALLIPTSMVEGIIFEREGRQNEAISEVSGKWGLHQTITGPVLVIPYELSYLNKETKETYKETKFAYLLPDELKVNGQVNPEKRYRGIYEVVLYESQLVLEGKFSRPELDKLVPPESRVLWEKAFVCIGIPDLRGLEDQVTLTWNGQSVLFDPGLPAAGVAESGIHAPVPVNQSDPYNFKVNVAVKGSGTLYFTPVGKVSEVNLQSPWPDPSFTGAFLPDEKNISAAGFDAKWKVLNLNRNYPQQWTSDQSVQFGGSSFGIQFLLPVDNYQKSTRSIKYAILFIGLTFLTLFFIEMRQSRRIHPFQYALIGLALVIFYTLLVSISEHLTFNVAYLIAALMTIGLTGWYAKSLFQSGRMALLMAGTLSILYGFLFVVLQLQDYALLIGSLGLFLILGAVMYVSRKINWNAPGRAD